MDKNTEIRLLRYRRFISASSVKGTVSGPVRKNLMKALYKQHLGGFFRFAKVVGTAARLEDAPAVAGV
jgi:hypothetical protein